MTEASMPTKAVDDLPIIAPQAPSMEFPTSREAAVTVPIVDVSGHFPASNRPAGERRGPVFVADGRDGPDLLDMREAVQPIAQLCAHKDTQTPLMIGIVGPSGSGKSFALERLRVAIAAL